MLNHDQVRRSFKRAARMAEVPGARLHDSRHYYASLLLRQGESVKVVQARLGHASAQETLDTCSHLWPDSEDMTRATVGRSPRTNFGLPADCRYHCTMFSQFTWAST
jgi:integrase